VTTLDLSPWFNSIEDQKGLGACTCYSSGSIREFIQNYDLNYRDVHSILSKLYLYYKVRRKIGKGKNQEEIKPDKEEGSSLIKPLLILKNNGCCVKRWYFNDEHSYYYIKPKEKANTDAPRQKIGKYRSLPRNDPSMWVRALLDRRPIFFAMHVGQNFMSHKVIDPKDDLFDESVMTETIGPHAMVIVGYNSRKATPDGRQIPAFRVRNSWGTGWGNYGYAWVAQEVIHKNLWEHEPLYVIDDIRSDQAKPEKKTSSITEGHIIKKLENIRENYLKKGETLAWHDETKEEHIRNLIDLLKELEAYDKILGDKKVDEDKMIEALEKFLNDVEYHYSHDKSVKHLKDIPDEKINKYLEDIEKMFLNSTKVASFMVDGKID